MGFPTHRLGQGGTPWGSANPGGPGICGRVGKRACPPYGTQAPVAVASSTLTPGPIVDETEIFFR
jgi:hypothetical protein